jgi:hypothetical protein
MSFRDIRLFSERVFFGDQSAASCAYPGPHQVAIAGILWRFEKNDLAVFGLHFEAKFKSQSN